MDLLDNYLQVKQSTLPNAGKGLFTKKFIAKGSLITEYKGKITNWKDTNHDDGKNPYIFYVSRNHVLDAKEEKIAFAHYANDAKGFKRVPGLKNNGIYIVKNKRVFIQALKDIQPKEEIFVAYGKEYWDVMKKNKNI